jgi:hypothetical protein
MPFGNFFFSHKKEWARGGGLGEKKNVNFLNAVCD